MSAPKQRKTAAQRGTSLALRFRNRLREHTLSQAGQKRPWSESDDDLSTTDSEEASSLEDALDSDQDTDSGEDMTPPQPTLSDQTKRAARRLADQVLPEFSRWMVSARYIQPPEHRIPPRKRSRGSNPKPPSILIETQDPADPSTILILRVDGYFRLACPFFVSHPAHHESCALEHDLCSISDLFKHLATCHPSVAYCPICGQVFDRELARDLHIRASVCACRDFDPPQGVSRSQLRTIVREDDTNQRESRRWRRIYSLLLPGADRPPRGAAYLDEGLPLAVAMAGDYWASRGRRAVEEYLAGEGSSEKGEIRGERVEAFCELAGRELVRCVVADAQESQAALSE